MSAMNQLEVLISSIRNARKRIVSSALIISFISLFVFVFGSYFFLFQYITRLSNEYYGTILKNVSEYQEISIGKETYWDDLEEISLELKNRKGVVEVWSTDRFGKLVFHSDPVFLSEYKSKRLPLEYHDSINHMWEFQQGYPKLNIEETDSWFIQRLSIPLYPFGREDYDFIIGMDVKRIIFLPDDMLHLQLFLAGYILFSLFVLFFPVFIWIRSRFSGMISKARFVAGSMNLAQTAEAPLPWKAAAQQKEEEPLPAGSPIDEGTAQRWKMEPRFAEEREEKPPVRPFSPVAEEIDKELFGRSEQAPQPPEKAGAPEPEEEIAHAPVVSVGEERKIEEKLRTNPTLILMDMKHSVYRRKDLDLPFIQTASHVYHSKTSSGSYLLYIQKDSHHLYMMFSYPDINLEFAADQLNEISNRVHSEFEESEDNKSILKGMNNYCVENNIHIDASAVMIDEREEKVAYTSCGEGYALYLKHNEESVKELKLDLSGLGRLSEDEFEEAFSYAEIDFVPNDLFVLLPQNGADIRIGEKTLIDILKEMLLENEDRKVSEIGHAINDMIELHKKSDPKFPESGFMIMKFQ
jgi:hypothetical protein